MQNPFDDRFRSQSTLRVILYQNVIFFAALMLTIISITSMILSTDYVATILNAISLSLSISILLAHLRNILAMRVAIPWFFVFIALFSANLVILEGVKTKFVEMSFAIVCLLLTGPGIWASYRFLRRGYEI